jgi:hypothetical protein
MRKHRESGEGRVQFFFWLIVFAAALLVAFRVIPVKVKDAQLVDFTIELAQFRNHLPAERIEKDIFNKARELDLPLERKAIKVEKFRERIRMKFSYTVPIDFPGYTYVWTIDHEIDRPLFAAL